MKFQPYFVSMKKRTKDKKSQTGPWIDFDGPYFTEVKHQGKVSVFIIEMVKSKPIDIGSLVMKFTYRNTM